MSSELLEKYLQGLCTENEKVLVELWYNQLHQLQNQPDAIPQAQKTQLLDEGFRNISARIDQYDGNKKVKQISFYRLAAVAASLLFVIGFYYSTPASFKAGKFPATRYTAQSGGASVHFANTESRIVKHQLPDGSTVWMHKGSALTYPKKFAKDSRTVKFTGEGFFSITKNKNSPFYIFSDEMTVRVLGTSFNLRASAANKPFKISVVTGSVMVITPDNQAERQQVILKPNQQAIFQTGSKKLISQSIPVQQKKEIFQPISIRFNDTPVSKVIVQLEKKFDITIRLSDRQIAQCRLNADFDQQPLAEILEMLCRSLEADYSIQDKTITIKGTPCE